MPAAGWPATRTSASVPQQSRRVQLAPCAARVNRCAKARQEPSVLSHEKAARRKSGAVPIWPHLARRSEERASTPPKEMITMAENTVTLHRVHRAPPERVHRAFLDPAATIKCPPHGFTGKVQHLKSPGDLLRRTILGRAHSSTGRRGTRALAAEPASVRALEELAKPARPPCLRHSDPTQRGRARRPQPLRSRRVTAAVTPSRSKMPTAWMADSTRTLGRRSVTIS